MAAMMGGTMRSPLTAMIFTLELTHDLNLLPGLLVACIAGLAAAVVIHLLTKYLLGTRRAGYFAVALLGVLPASS